MRIGSVACRGFTYREIKKQFGNNQAYCWIRGLIWLSLQEAWCCFPLLRFRFRPWILATSLALFGFRSSDI